MRFLQSITVACLLATNTPVFAHPQSIADIQIAAREEANAQEARDVSIFSDVSDLWKRKGGGSGGGKGGGSSGSSGSGKGGSSGTSTGYVPISMMGSGGVRESGRESQSERGRSKVAGVGSSTSSQNDRESGRSAVAGVGSSTSSQRPNRAPHTTEDLSEDSAAGELETARPRRFAGFFGGGAVAPAFLFAASKKKHHSNKHSSTSTGRGSSSSNTGGSTKTGSGVTPRFGGGRYYGGGATTPYSAGARSPLGIAPVFLGVGLLSIYPGLWLYGAYSYPYGHPYTFHNRTGRSNSTTNTTTPTRDLHFGEIEIRQDDGGVNETKPVTCLCAARAECGCDDSGNSTFLDSIIGDGTYSMLNQSLVTVADVNGTSTILLNGTLPNGTTASGGTEDAITSAAVRSVIEASGYWVVIAIVGLTCFAL